MASNYVIKYCDSASERQKILKFGYLRLSVTWNDGCEHTKIFYHCLHCNKTYLHTGIHYHQKDLKMTSGQKYGAGMRFLSNPDSHKAIIQEEFTRCFVNGQLRRHPHVSTSPVHPFAFTPIQRQDVLPAPVSEPSHRPETIQRAHAVVPQPQVEMLHDELEEPDIEDLRPDLNGCFSNEGFDLKHFEEFARDFLSRECETRQEKENQGKEKAKIVSVLAQNLYIMCTLSKDQIKNITCFWKAMISFIAPECADIARRIHASYSSCLRHAQRRRAEMEARQAQMFRDCLHFSLALDTAQFGRDHFLSCIGRFGFDDHIFQEIIIFEKVTEKTGRELARFVLEKLAEKIVISQKWSP